MPGLIVDRFLKKFSKFFKPELKPINVLSTTEEDQILDKSNPDRQCEKDTERALNDHRPDPKE
jgi:hypothetical protein